MKFKSDINRLFEVGPDWQWDANLSHWKCELEDGFIAVAWSEWLNPPGEGPAKLSKSTEEKKVRWDGFCLGVPGGPEMAERQGPILSWIRNGITTQRVINNSSSSIYDLEALLHDNNAVRCGLAYNQKTPTEILKRLPDDKGLMSYYLAHNHNTPVSIRDKLLNDIEIITQQFIKWNKEYHEKNNA